ncbi:right-handed parallel beta-helix repeat-containing protein [Leptolyngbya sp. NIES-2104]|uniref:right-handed parallel beta-helix repeat-containing protein n=1 Tax=Leptolyngbya sp. NIES-2104 TaxID=1552121 RepID=UPI0006ECCB70|nr:right-handed parallel beta-helix repeat-containing protein [Leptolyngbya sp. NIES-2104]GAP94314.1 hypothetical protein NIES2104_08250 [Leptolyngbya sp. NIES-2104]
MKRIKRIGWTLKLGTIALLASTTAYATEPGSTQPDPVLKPLTFINLAQTDATPAAPTPKAADLIVPARAGVGYNTSGGGYEGFGSFQGFIPLYQTPGQDLGYLLGRLLLDNDAKLSGNVLFGYRFYNSAANRIYGTYLSYDNRDTGSNVFSQLGVGFETLGETWDARLNAYIPLGDSRQTVRQSAFNTGTQVSDLQFQNNFLLVTETRSQRIIRDLEALVAGFDGEVGVRLARFPNGGDVRGYAGLYYLSAGETSFGVRGRLEARPLNDLTLGLGVQHDGIFGTNVIASVSLSFPPSRSRRSDPTSVLARLGDDPVRINAIAIDRQQEIKDISTTSNIFLTNPATGQPYIFQHVTLGASGGNGTFENPFGIVQSALDTTRSDGNAIVYVQAGSNPGIPAFTIPDRVQVLSTGAIQPLVATLNGQPLPGFQIPRSGSGVFPTINGTVTMRSDTVLSGFTIASATGAGVAFTNVNSVEVRDNFIRNTADTGILGNGATTVNLLRNQIDSTNNQGIFLQNIGTATITNNVVSNTIESVADDELLTANGQGIAIVNSAGQLDLNLINNQIRANFSDGVLIGLTGRASGTTPAATANINISNNTIENNGGATPVRGDGIAIGLGQDAVVNNLLIENNTIRNNGDEGIDIRLGLQAIPTTNPTTARLGGTIQNNTIANNGQNGVQVQARGSTTARVSIDRNTINANGLLGVDLSTASVIGLGTPDLSANVRQNTFTLGTTPPPGSFSRVVQAQTTPSPGVSQTLCLNLTGNTFASFSEVVLDNVANALRGDNEAREQTESGKWR